MQKIIAGTGHRFDKLGGYTNAEKTFSRLIDLCTAALDKYKPVEVISGMALGFDLGLAGAALKSGIPLCASLPCLSEFQTSKWNNHWKAIYNNILSKVSRVEYCPGGSYASWKMQKRNEWMVNNATHILALWNGSNGGTANCISFANKVGKPIINLWNSWEKYK